MHIGIGAAVLILGLIYFAIVSPGFRAVVVMFAGIVALVIAILIARSAQAQEKPVPADCAICDSGVFTPAVAQAIKEGAAATKADPNIMAGIAYSRSHGDPNAIKGNRKGLMMLTEEEMRRVSGGKGNLFNPRDSVMAAVALAREAEKPAPKAKRPYFDPEQIRRGVAAGVISQEQYVWYMRYNAGENPGPFPQSPRPQPNPLLEPSATTQCTTTWAPIGIGGQWETTCN
jgi:hypothetical protein